MQVRLCQRHSLEPSSYGKRQVRGGAHGGGRGGLVDLWVELLSGDTVCVPATTKEGGTEKKRISGSSRIVEPFIITAAEAR